MTPVIVAATASEYWGDRRTVRAVTPYEARHWLDETRTNASPRGLANAMHTIVITGTRVDAARAELARWIESGNDNDAGVTDRVLAANAQTILDLLDGKE